jgi:hypothetical protein
MIRLQLLANLNTQRAACYPDCVIEFLVFGSTVAITPEDIKESSERYLNLEPYLKKPAKELLDRQLKR